MHSQHKVSVSLKASSFSCDTCASLTSVHAGQSCCWCCCDGLRDSILRSRHGPCEYTLPRPTSTRPPVQQAGCGPLSSHTFVTSMHGEVQQSVCTTLFCQTLPRICADMLTVFVCFHPGAAHSISSLGGLWGCICCYKTRCSRDSYSHVCWMEAERCQSLACCTCHQMCMMYKFCKTRITTRIWALPLCHWQQHEVAVPVPYKAMCWSCIFQFSGNLSSKGHHNHNTNV